jgi:hypothetical protein
MTADFSRMKLLPEWKRPAWLPPTHDRGTKTYANSCSVKEHMKSIRDETKAISDDSIQQLHTSEHQSEHKVVKNPPAHSVFEDLFAKCKR